MNMKRRIETIPLELIKLDEENVRFGGDIAKSQREAIELLVADPNDAKKLLKLIEHISINGLDPTELQMVTPTGKKGEFLVLEGNRRLAAIKLLQNPELCLDPSLRRSLSVIKREMPEELPREIECSVVESREAGDIWIEIKHTGENAGVGRVGWDPDIRDERRARQTGIESIGRQLRKLVGNNDFLFEEEVLQGVKAIPVTTLTRLFSSRPAQDKLGYKVEGNFLTPLYEMQYISKALSFVILMFINHGYNVNDVYFDKDRRKFLGHIPPEMLPSVLFESSKASPSKNNADASNSKNNTNFKKDNFDGSDNSDINKGNENHGQDNSEENSDKKKIRAKPSSTTRKYLVPWSLKIDNSRINKIYKELRSHLEVDKVVNATAITFRVFLELTCDEFQKRLSKDNISLTREDNDQPLKLDGKVNLSVKIRAVSKYLVNSGAITKNAGKTISKRAGSENTIGSVDHFNQFVHDSSSSPIPSEIKEIADEYRPLLEAVWK